MKKLKTLSLGIACIFALSGCEKPNNILIDPNKETYHVGVCQLVQHPALDAATNGFKDKLTSELRQRGREVEIDIQNASNDLSLCPTIINGFVAQKVDLILGNATPALQAAFTATSQIPVLGTSITDYGEATGLAMKDGKSGVNISGTSDLAEISQQIDLMLSLLNKKTVNKVGILSCSGEANSAFQVREAKKALEAHGKTVVSKTFSETTDLTSVCTSLLDCDAIYLPTDNTVAANTELIRQNITDKGIPVFAGEEGICSGCGFATLSIDYYALGEITGKMAAEILVGEKDIRTYEIQYDTNPTKKYNKAICEQLGLLDSIPEDFVEIVVEEK